MIFDKEVLLADDLAFGATSKVVYLGPPIANPAGPGSGKPIALVLTGKGVTTAGEVTFVIETSDTEGGTYSIILELYVLPAEVNDGNVICHLPSNVSRWISASLSGATAGTWTCGIIINE